MYLIIKNSNSSTFFLQISNKNIGSMDEIIRAMESSGGSTTTTTTTNTKYVSEMNPFDIKIGYDQGGWNGFRPPWI